MDTVRFCSMFVILTVVLFGHYSVGGYDNLLYKTYRHTLDNFQTVTCNKCKPGTYFISHCTADKSDAKCKECHENEFNPNYNQAFRCARCDVRCHTDREVVEHNCTATHNLSCKCRDGFYRLEGTDGLCSNYDKCPPGQGVARLGDAKTNTKCEPCEPGNFSSSKSETERCMPCKVCPPGYRVKHACMPDNDRICEIEEEDSSVGRNVGIVVGCAMLVIFIIIVVCICCRKRTNISKEQDECLVPTLCYKKICHDSEKEHESRLHEKEPMVGSGPAVPDVGQINGSAHVGKKIHDYQRTTSQQSADTVEPVPQFRDVHKGKTDTILNDLSHDLIDKDWEFFFRILFAVPPSAYINEAKINYPNNVREQIYQLLLTWMRLVSGQATLTHIVQVLEEQKRQDLVHKYKQCIVFQRLNSSSSSQHTDV